MGKDLNGGEGAGCRACDAAGLIGRSPRGRPLSIATESGKSATRPLFFFRPGAAPFSHGFAGSLLNKLTPINFSVGPDQMPGR